MDTPDSGSRPGNVDAGSGQGPIDAGGPGHSDGGATSGGFRCSSGTLFAGDPLYDTPTDRPSDGSAILSDPPFPYRTVVFSKGQIITHDGQEIWRASLTDGKLHKIAGTESSDQALITGPCSGARFANIFSVALASDGSLFVSDQTANAVLKITDPLGSGCMVGHYAGTATDVAPGDVDPDNPPYVGNVDGPGVTARFALPERMAVDESDNIYLWDQGNDSMRKIGSDGDHTVSTIATDVSDGGSLVSEVYLGGKLYVYGLAPTAVFLTAIDTTSHAKQDLFRGGADLFGGSSGDSNLLGGIVTDGVGLIVFINGQLFYVKIDGTVVLPALAGVYGQGLEFSPGYDPTAAHDAATIEVPAASGLSATAGAEGFLTLDDGGLYMTSQYGGNQFVLKVSCGN